MPLPRTTAPVTHCVSPSQTHVILPLSRAESEYILQYQYRRLKHMSSLIRIYTVCHSVCIVWTHYSMVEPHSSNFRVITTNVLGVRIFKKFTVSQTESGEYYSTVSPSQTHITGGEYSSAGKIHRVSSS